MASLTTAVLAAAAGMVATASVSGLRGADVLDRVADQAADDQDDCDEGDGDRAAHDSTSVSGSLPAVKVAAAAMISLGVSWMVNGVTS